MIFDEYEGWVYDLSKQQRTPEEWAKLREEMKGSLLGDLILGILDTPWTIDGKPKEADDHRHS
jgi:hypothetical protein